MTTYGAEQLLTGLLQLGEGALYESIDRWPRIPDFTRATIDERKFRDYALDPDHPQGKEKARLFRAALGFERQDAGLLASRVREALFDGPTIQGLKLTSHGVSWHLDLTVEGTNGQSDVLRTAWLVDYEIANPVPRLISARPLRNQQ